MKHSTVIAFFLIVLNSHGQVTFDKSKISKATGKIVSKIEKINELMGSAVYFGGIRPEQYDFFIQLKGNASKAELTELTNHPNGVVRCYSFWALSYDSSANLFPIIVKHITDDELVKTQFGCIGSREKVGDFFIDVATPRYVDLNSAKLDSVQIRELDSILIYTPTNLYARDEAISRVNLSERLYFRIRELAIKENNQAALVMLAKYQKEQDVALILKNRYGNKRDNDGFYYTYQAIREFPHPAFVPLLEKNLKKTLDDDHYSTEWGKLYEAIASYKNDKAIELLSIPFTEVKHENIRGYHIAFVFGAVQMFKSPIYDDLIWNLWSNEKRISPDIFYYLNDKNSQRVFELTKQTLLAPEEFQIINADFDYDNPDSSQDLLNIMFDLALNREKTFAIEVLTKNLKNEDISLFQFFAAKAAKLKDPSFIDPLFGRLEKDDNPHVYLKATEALIAFNNKEINRRIGEAIKKNNNLAKDWGGKEFKKLLEEKGIKIN